MKEIFGDDEQSWQDWMAYERLQRRDFEKFCAVCDCWRCSFLGCLFSLIPAAAPSNDLPAAPVHLFRYETSEVGVERPGAPARAAVEAVRQPR
jgi:hypothetical protein